MKQVFFLLVFILAISCKQQKKDDKVASQVNTDFEPSEAMALMNNNCYLCHSASAPMKTGRIGPPMIAIKAHYLTDYKSEYAFVNAIWEFVKEPAEDKALLKGAVKRFGVMPKQTFKEPEIRAIAKLMFNYKIDEPDWFAAHWQEKGFEPYLNSEHVSIPIKSDSIVDYNALGLEMAMGTKKILGKNLMGTIQEKGVEAAVKFCNIKAYPLTDSMAVGYNAKIKRVSDKPRNPQNQADQEALIYISMYKHQLKQNKNLEAVVKEEKDSVQFYYPIVTNQLCLKCHGEKVKDITEPVYESLQELYPADRAVGYSENEVRGVWNISFKKQ